jgi:hypothetical protein
MITTNRRQPNAKRVFKPKEKPGLQRPPDASDRPEGQIIDPKKVKRLDKTTARRWEQTRTEHRPPEVYVG